MSIFTFHHAAELALCRLAGFGRQGQRRFAFSSELREYLGDRQNYSGDNHAGAAWLPQGMVAYAGITG